LHISLLFPHACRTVFLLRLHICEYQELIPFWVFNQPKSLLLNLAVGGNWPGDPDATSTFPQKMLVDYVRVYEKLTAP